MADPLFMVKGGVVRSELNRLASLLSQAGEECFIVTASATDEESYLLGSINGTNFVEKCSLIVKTEFLPYLQKQLPAKVASRSNEDKDPYYDNKRVLRSLMSHLSSKLHDDGEECFIVTATNPNILGSDKGIEYFSDHFKAIQTAFSRNNDALHPDINTHGQNQVETMRPNVSSAEQPRPIKGLIPSHLSDLNTNKELLPTHRTCSTPVPETNNSVYVKAEITTNAMPVTHASDGEDVECWSISDDGCWSENESSNMNNSFDQDTIQSVQSPLTSGSALQKRKEVCNEMESSNKKTKTEDNGERTDESADDIERVDKTKDAVGTSNEYNQASSSNTVGIKLFVCVKIGCSKTFPDRWKQLRHYQSHTDEKLIYCKVCKDQFKSGTSAIRHCRTVHKDIENLKPTHPSRQQLEAIERHLIAVTDTV